MIGIQATYAIIKILVTIVKKKAKGKILNPVQPNTTQIVLTRYNPSISFSTYNQY